MPSNPLFFCFAGPTASGKSTICRRVLGEVSNLKISISTTTRQARPDELEGQDYFFVSEAEFERRRVAGLFFESAEFSGHHYGTELQNIDLARAADSDLLLDIEIQGVAQLKQSLGKQVITIFVFPTSFAELENRLRQRNSESEDQIQLRLKTARKEIEVLTAPGFADFLLINDNLASSVRLASSIISVSRADLSRREALETAKFLK